ncbi:MAG: bifunctional phosphoribosylaminoimidazolecarboxamide formyltransferase/IMP cyclohydrolase [Legionellales bacterium]|nr:bifunctional phosphoribosylaminoimidazolecarboxamide formyltransferase/IMP cyclohydrolase [Legionellales bacterium]
MRALISVSDKQDIVPLAQGLIALGWEILSTGGTATLLREHQIPTTDVADYTGFPEMMEGRVKTLHPKIHGGILGRRGQDDAVMQAHHIEPIDLVVVNLYPFQQVTAQPNCDFATAIEHIDIGGPSLLRAAAKNYQHVTVLVDPTDYATVLTQLQQHATVDETLRLQLAQKCFAHTARYDTAIAAYLAPLTTPQPTSSPFPASLSLQYQKQQDLRYGENPHQAAALYTTTQASADSLSQAQSLQGKSLSFNNLVDSQAAWDCVNTFQEPACVIVKHANPCGIAQHASLITAYQHAYRTDPSSSFGGIIAFNRPLTAQLAQKILDQQFVEVLIAPTVEPTALTVLQTKPNLRVLACQNPPKETSTSKWQLRSLGKDNLLVQQIDHVSMNAEQCTVVTQRQPTKAQWQDLLFAWQAVKFVKSNAIVYAKDQATLGIGAGQMSRIDSAQIAGIKAAHQQLSLHEAVMASDAFFPFADSVETAAALGISAIIQPGGSKRDAQVIQAADEANLTMVFTGIRHFYH